MDRVVLILGAGGSVKYFDPHLTTETLTASVCEGSSWTDLLNRYHAINGGVNTIKEQVVLDLLRYLKQLGSSLNFEDYAEIIDKVASYMFDRHGNLILHRAIQFLHARPDHSINHTWIAVPFLFRQLIAEQIEEKHANEQAQDYQLRIKDLGLFLKHLFSTADLSVFSFNYDDVILDALGRSGVILEDGFNNVYFNAADFLNKQSVLAFPHGHARFVLDRKGLRKYSTIAEANRKRLENLYSARGDETTYRLRGPNCYSFNTFITSGRDKDDSFNINPYSAYYQRLAYDLLKARVVIVIGSSLQDAHILRLLINFIKVRSDNQIFVVDYDTDPVDIFNSFMDSRSLIFQLFEALDVRSLPMWGNFNNYRYKFQDDVDKLNATGFGQIYPQISMCKLGLYEFLTKYSLILAQTCSL